MLEHNQVLLSPNSHLVMSGNTIIVVAEGLASADLDGEAVLLDIDAGTYYGLNEVGARIMKLVKEPKSVDYLIDTMLQEYEVEAKQLERDLTAFLQEMADRQLIRIENGTFT